MPIPDTAAKPAKCSAFHGPRFIAGCENTTWELVESNADRMVLLRNLFDQVFMILEPILP